METLANEKEVITMLEKNKQKKQNRHNHSLVLNVRSQKIHNQPHKELEKKHFFLPPTNHPHTQNT